eukprot:TRINITY_DN10149_c0_g1_i3.p1 TRINITY_DN10149_c0_g1~~TRINITY_DN10149_c0_g1_i3.p1  ORF type:complete len:635 (-),score=101.53 TRINITY_DN10149_c0_g1_i3:285-2189(-)
MTSCCHAEHVAKADHVSTRSVIAPTSAWSASGGAANIKDALDIHLLELRQRLLDEFALWSAGGVAGAAVGAVHGSFSPGHPGLASSPVSGSSAQRSPQGHATGRLGAAPARWEDTATTASQLGARFEVSGAKIEGSYQAIVEASTQTGSERGRLQGGTRRTKSGLSTTSLLKTRQQSALAVTKDSPFNTIGTNASKTAADPAAASNARLKEYAELFGQKMVSEGPYSSRTQKRVNWAEILKDPAFSAFFFDSVMGIAILLNAIVVGLSADIQTDWQGWIVIDIIFFVIFLVEACIKWFLQGTKGYFCGEERKWNLFELMLIMLAAFEIVTAIGIPDQGRQPSGSLFRMVRLIRIAKILRVMRLQAFADLTMMINGTVGGIKTLFWAMVLILVPTYIIALTFRETLGRSEGAGSDSFKDIPSSFFTMFRCIVAGDCSQDEGRPLFVLIVEDHGYAFAVIYMLVMLFMMFGLFNVIIAIYVENTVAAAKFNDLVQKRERLRDQEMFQKKAFQLAKLIKVLQSGEGEEASDPTLEELVQMEVDVDLFHELCTHQQFQEVLRDLDVNEEDQLDLFETLDVDGGGTLDLVELVTGIKKLRGEARKSDIIGVSLVVRHLQGILREQKEQKEVQRQRADSR